MEDPPPEETVEGGGEGEEPPAEAQGRSAMEPEPEPEPAPEPEVTPEPEPVTEEVPNPPPSAGSDYQTEVQVADHMPTEVNDVPNQGDGQVRRESTLGDIPVVRSSVIDKLKDADQEARDLMALMANMRKSIEELQNKPHMTEEDTQILEVKQMELLKKLSEFEAITKKMQVLVGLSGTSLPQIPEEGKPAEGTKPGKDEKGKPVGTGEFDEKAIQIREDDFYARPEDMLPQLVVCGFANQVPRILICETGDKPKPKPKQKCPAIAKKKFPGPRKPQPQMGKCYCGVEEQLRAKDNTINCLKKKMCALECEVRRTVDENSNLSAQLEQANKQKCPPSPVCPNSCVPQCVTNLNTQPKTETCPSTCIGQLPKEPETSLCPVKCPTKCPANAPVDSATAQKCNLNAMCLKSQLNIIELEVQNMRTELYKAQKDQQEMEEQRELLKCAAPKCLTANSCDISPCACATPPAPPAPPNAGCVCSKQR